MITLHAKMFEFCLCVLLWVCLWSLLLGRGHTQITVMFAELLTHLLLLLLLMIVIMLLILSLHIR